MPTLYLHSNAIVSGYVESRGLERRDRRRCFVEYHGDGPTTIIGLKARANIIIE